MNNIPPRKGLQLPEPSYASDSRQQRRHRLLKDCAGKLAGKYRSVTERSVQWPFEMPRRVRRKIVRNMAKHLTREHGLKAIT